MHVYRPPIVKHSKSTAEPSHDTQTGSSLLQKEETNTTGTGRDIRQLVSTPHDYSCHIESFDYFPLQEAIRPKEPPFTFKTVSSVFR